MMFVLDTDVLSTFQGKQPYADIVNRVAGIGWPDLRSTVATVTKIQRGIERSRASHPETANQIEHGWTECPATPMRRMPHMDSR